MRDFHYFVFIVYMHGTDFMDVHNGQMNKHDRHISIITLLLDIARVSMTLYTGIYVLQ